MRNVDYRNIEQTNGLAIPQLDLQAISRNYRVIQMNVIGTKVPSNYGVYKVQRQTRVITIPLHRHSIFPEQPLKRHPACF